MADTETLLLGNNGDLAGSNRLPPEDDEPMETYHALKRRVAAIESALTVQPENSPLVTFARSLKDAGVLDSPARMKSLEAENRRLKGELDELRKVVKMLASPVVNVDVESVGREVAKAVKKLAKRMDASYLKTAEAIAPRGLKRIKAMKTEDGGWDIEVRD